MKITLDGKYQTKYGLPVRIICIDKITESPYCVVALLLHDKEEEISVYTIEGKLLGNNKPNDLDLEEVVPYRPYLISEAHVLCGEYIVDKKKKKHEVTRIVIEDLNVVFYTDTGLAIPANVLCKNYFYKGKPCGYKREEL